MSTVAVFPRRFRQTLANIFSFLLSVPIKDLIKSSQRFQHAGLYAQFWTSSSASGVVTFDGHTYSIAVGFGFGKTYQYVQRATVRRIAMPVFSIDNEDVYNPF
jgi:hypothetical protein